MEEFPTKQDCMSMACKPLSQNSSVPIPKKVPQDLSSIGVKKNISPIQDQSRSSNTSNLVSQNESSGVSVSTSSHPNTYTSGTHASYNNCPSMANVNGCLTPTGLTTPHYYSPILNSPQSLLRPLMTTQPPLYSPILPPQQHSYTLPHPSPSPGSFANLSETFRSVEPLSCSEAVFKEVSHSSRLNGEVTPDKTCNVQVSKQFLLDINQKRSNMQNSCSLARFPSCAEVMAKSNNIHDQQHVFEEYVRMYGEDISCRSWGDPGTSSNPPQQGSSSLHRNSNFSSHQSGTGYSDCRLDSSWNRYISGGPSVNCLSDSYSVEENSNSKHAVKGFSVTSNNVNSTAAVPVTEHNVTRAHYDYQAIPAGQLASILTYVQPINYPHSQNERNECRAIETRPDVHCGLNRNDSHPGQQSETSKKQIPNTGSLPLNTSTSSQNISAENLTSHSHTTSAHVPPSSLSHSLPSNSHIHSSSEVIQTSSAFPSVPSHSISKSNQDGKEVTAVSVSLPTSVQETPSCSAPNVNKFSGKNPSMRDPQENFKKEVNKDMNRDEPTSSNFCLLCAATIEESTTHSLIDSLITVPSKITVSEKIALIIGYPLPRDLLPSLSICPKCFHLINEVDLLEQRLKVCRREVLLSIEAMFERNGIQSSPYKRFQRQHTYAGSYQHHEAHHASAYQHLGVNGLPSQSNNNVHASYQNDPQNYHAINSIYPIHNQNNPNHVMNQNQMHLTQNYHQHNAHILPVPHSQLGQSQMASQRSQDHLTQLSAGQMNAHQHQQDHSANNQMHHHQEMTEDHLKSQLLHQHSLNKIAQESDIHKHQQQSQMPRQIQPQALSQSQTQPPQSHPQPQQLHQQTQLQPQPSQQLSQPTLPQPSQHLHQQSTSQQPSAQVHHQPQLQPPQLHHSQSQLQQTQHPAQQLQLQQQQQHSSQHHLSHSQLNQQHTTQAHLLHSHCPSQAIQSSSYTPVFSLTQTTPTSQQHPSHTARKPQASTNYQNNRSHVDHQIPQLESLQKQTYQVCTDSITSQHMPSNNNDHLQLSTPSKSNATQTSHSQTIVKYSLQDISPLDSSSKSENLSIHSNDLEIPSDIHPTSLMNKDLQQKDKKKEGSEAETLMIESSTQIPLILSENSTSMSVLLSYQHSSERELNSELLVDNFDSPYSTNPNLNPVESMKSLSEPVKDMSTPLKDYDSKVQNIDYDSKVQNIDPDGTWDQHHGGITEDINVNSSAPINHPECDIDIEKCDNLIENVEEKCKGESDLEEENNLKSEGSNSVPNIPIDGTIENQLSPVTSNPDELNLLLPSHPSPPPRPLGPAEGLRNVQDATEYHKPTLLGKNVKAKKHAKLQICRQCDQVFSNRQALIRHIERRHKSISLNYRCGTCHKKFNSERTLKQHAKTHKTFPCKICDKIFLKKTKLKKHFKEHSQQSLVCKKCNKKTGSMQALISHLKTHDRAPKSFICSICSKNFTCKRNLDHHTLIHTGEKPFKCENCNKDFRNRSNIINHHKICIGKFRFMCSTCGRGFVLKSLYDRHSAEHEGRFAHACSICHKGFSRSNDLHSHFNSHGVLSQTRTNPCTVCTTLGSGCNTKKPRNTKIVCEVCGKKIYRKETMRDHLSFHAGKRHHACHLCSMSYFYKTNLTLHIKTVHYKIFPFSCSVCRKAFASSGNYKVHMRTHTGEKPYQCKSCGKAFTAISNYKRHLKCHITHAQVIEKHTEEAELA